MEDKRVYRKPGRSQRSRQGAVLAMFGLFIVGFSLFNVIAPKRVTSELFDGKPCLMAVGLTILQPICRIR